MKVRSIAIILMCAITGAAHSSTDMLQVAQELLTPEGQTGAITSINPKEALESMWQDWDFYTTGRLAVNLPKGVGNIGVDLGGPGAGSLLMAFPPARPASVEFYGLPEELSPFIKILSRSGFEMLGDLTKGGGAKGLEVDFLSADGGAAAEKSSAIERMLRFRVTPEFIFGVKALLLAKHFLQHRSDEFNKVSLSTYALDAAVMVFRLMKTWRRDVKTIGGFSTVLEKKIPELSKLLRTVSKLISPDKDEKMLHKGLDSLWHLVIDGGGILFAADGTVSRGLGFGVTGLSCTTESDAKALAQFLSQKQINWSKIESQDMPDAPFVQRVASLIEAYEKQLGEKAGSDFARVKRIFADIIARKAQEDMGRFDPANSMGEHIDARLRSKEFVSLTADGGPLADYHELPQVVTAGKYVYYCSNQVGPFDMARLLVVVLCQAAWRYFDIMAGNSEFGTEVSTAIKESERARASAIAYTQTDEGAAIIKPALALFLDRPTIDIVGLASKMKLDQKAVAAAMGASNEAATTAMGRVEEVTKVLQEKGKELLEKLKDEAQSFVDALEAAHKKAKDDLAKGKTLERFKAYVKTKSALIGEQARKNIIDVIDAAQDPNKAVEVIREQLDVLRDALGSNKKVVKDDSFFGSRDSVRVLLSQYEQLRRNKGAKKEERNAALKNARDALASFYEAEQQIYEEVLKLFAAPWSESSDTFEKDIRDAYGALPDDKRSELQQAYDNLQSIDQSGEVGTRELVEQMKDAYERAVKAESKARKDKASFDTEAKAAEQARKLYELNQGRFDFETILHDKLATLREAARQVRMIDEQTPDAVESSRRGMRILHREALFFGKESWIMGMKGGSAVVGRIADFANRAKEMKPLRDEVTRRVEQVRRLFPKMEPVIAGAQSFMQWQMPGLFALDVR